jgi:hypothetical protein
VGKVKNAYNILVGNLEGKRPFERLRNRGEYSIKMNVKEIGWNV